MRKSIVLMLIATLVLGALMVSCNSDVSEGTSVGDKLVEIAISGSSTSKGISAVGSMENADAYYWYYKAGKNDNSVYRTGETVAVSNGVLGEGGWKPVKANNEAGLTNSNLGFFSTGDWLFSFVAYKKVATFNGDAATNGNDTLVPVYYQYNLAVEVSSNTIASPSDQKVYITVTPNVGQAQGDAEFVFPEAGLTWKYVNDTSADAQYTLAALNNKKAYMYVYYKDNSETNDTEHLLARSDDATISTADSGASATFNGFKGVDTNSAFTKDPVTIKSTYSGKNYTLYFRVVLSSNDEEIGSTNTQSVTAYTGGKITISSTGTASVYDNEVQYEVVISDIDAVAVSVTKSTATVDSPAVPVAPSEPTTVGDDNKTSSTQASAQKTITSSITAVEETAEKKTTVIIPAAGLEATTVTKTLTEKTENNKTVTTVTKSSSHTLDMEVKTDVTPSTISITAGQAKVAGVDLTLTKTTTTVTETATTVGGTTTTTEDTATSAPVTVPTFNDLYVTVSTYITKGLSGVNVVYDGTEQSGYNLVFDTTSENKNNPSVATASGNSGNSNAGTGYNPTTGLLVFKTNHFSSYIVTCAPVVKLIHGTTETGYATLEDALADSVNEDTITFVNNVTISADKTATSDRLVVSKNITINFGEYKLTAPGSLEPTDNWSALFITGNVVFDGTTGGILCQDNGNAAGPYAVTVRDGGTLTVNGGVYHGGGSTFYANEGTITINGGTISATAFESSYLMDFVLNCLDANYANHTANIVVKGGTFVAFNPGNCKAEGNNTNFVADGYLAIENGDNNWTVSRAYWINAASDSFDSGNGTQENPYIIKTPEQLSLLAKYTSVRSTDSLFTTYSAYSASDVWYELGADINLTGRVWTPICQYSDNPFLGHFDGKDHTITGISNMNISVGSFTLSGFEYEVILTQTADAASGGAYGLFAVVGEASISNIKFENFECLNPATGTGYRGVGAVAGLTYGKTAGATLTIDNCHLLSGNINVIGKVGGIVGDINDGGSIIFAEIKNCSNYATIHASRGTSSSEVGGILGRIENVNKLLMSNCHNYGSISGTGNVSVGGLVGSILYPGAQNTDRDGDGFRFYSCSSVSTLTGEDHNPGLIIGGVLSNYGNGFNLRITEFKTEAKSGDTYIPTAVTDIPNAGLLGYAGEGYSNKIYLFDSAEGCLKYEVYFNVGSSSQNYEHSWYHTL